MAFITGVGFGVYSCMIIVRTRRDSAGNGFRPLCYLLSPVILYERIRDSGPWGFTVDYSRSPKVGNPIASILKSNV